MKILLDVYGADHSPDEFILGAKAALAEVADLSMVLVGKEDEINAKLVEYSCDKTRIEIVHAPDVVVNEDVPTEAIRNKKESSMVRGLDLLNTREDICGMITAGSTGAALTGATLKIGRLAGVRRAALAPVLPTTDGGRCCLIDGGANVESTPEFLTQFAIMGISYMQAIYGIQNPRVALVSNGTEDKKGNNLVQETFKLLKAMPINFVGNMEATDSLSGKYDVIVCDGFVGNVLLKSLEGSRKVFLDLMKGALKSNARSKMGALLVKPALKKMLKTLGTDELGAAAFLGCKKLIAKAHGNSKQKQIRAAILQVEQMARASLVEKMADQIVKLNASVGQSVAQ